MIEPSDTYAELSRWLAEAGAVLDRVTITDDPRAGRGIVAAAPIAAGEPVLRIPRARVVTAEDARASAAGRALEGAPDHSSALVLAAWLLCEGQARVASQHRAYLASLPASFPTDPLFFSPSELALLEGSVALPLIHARRAALAREHALLRDRVPAFRELSLTAFLWARLCATTRVFGLTIAGRKTEVLVPLADMLNHHRPAPTRWTWDDAASGFVLLATEPIPAGAAVLTSYGVKSNGRLLVSYGFALADNDADEAVVPLSIPRGASCFDLKAELLGGVARECRFPAQHDAPASRAMLSFLRVAVATRAEMDRLGPPALLDPANVAPIGPRNELAALTALAEACEVALRRFPTSAAQDEEQLRDPAITINARHAILTRLGEKRVLAGHRDLAAAVRPWLALPRHSLARAVRERAAGGGEAARYLATYAAGIGARRRGEIAFFTRAAGGV
ncbi:MAG: SET domain-containing histone-lysine N-methyltransferase [Minicystis sp.]